MKRSLAGGLVALLILSPFIHGEITDDSAEWPSSAEDKSQEVKKGPEPVPVGGLLQVQSPHPPSPAVERAIQGPAVAIAATSHGSTHGSNYATFGQKCALDSEPGIRCNPSVGLTCDLRICTCRNSTIDPDLFHVWSQTGGKCYPIARRRDDWNCEFDVQCRASRQGIYSRCNFNTNKCVCADTEGLGREVVRDDGVCYVKKEIGSQCTTDVECQISIKGNAVCLGLLSQTYGVCACAGGYSHDPLLKECVELGTSEGSHCKSDRQCDDEKALGELARCNGDTGKCQCWDTKAAGTYATAFYKLTKKCYYKRALNEECSLREECALGFHRKGDCLPHPAYNDGKVCQCPKNENCTGGSGSLTFSLILMTLSALLLKSF